LTAALAELKASAGSIDGPDHMILLVLPAQPSELAALPGVCVTNKKVVVYAKGRDALSAKWQAMFLTDDMAYYLVLLIKQPTGDGSVNDDPA
jgi:hypothetical protein